jgi:hypothetical protein
MLLIVKSTTPHKLHSACAPGPLNYLLNAPLEAVAPQPCSSPIVSVNRVAASAAFGVAGTLSPPAISSTLHCVRHDLGRQVPARSMPAEPPSYRANPTIRFDRGTTASLKPRMLVGRDREDPAGRAPRAGVSCPFGSERSCGFEPGDSIQGNFIQENSIESAGWQQSIQFGAKVCRQEIPGRKIPPSDILSERGSMAGEERTLPRTATAFSP